MEIFGLWTGFLIALADFLLTLADFLLALADFLTALVDFLLALSDIFLVLDDAVETEMMEGLSFVNNVRGCGSKVRKFVELNTYSWAVKV